MPRESTRPPSGTPLFRVSFYGNPLEPTIIYVEQSPQWNKLVSEVGEGDRNASAVAESAGESVRDALDFAINGGKKPKWFRSGPLR